MCRGGLDGLFTKSQCCCTVGRAWSQQCEPCPSKGSGTGSLFNLVIVLWKEQFFLNSYICPHARGRHVVFGLSVSPSVWPSVHPQICVFSVTLQTLEGFSNTLTHIFATLRLCTEYMSHWLQLKVRVPPWAQRSRRTILLGTVYWGWWWGGDLSVFIKKQQANWLLFDKMFGHKKTFYFDALKWFNYYSLLLCLKLIKRV